MKDFEYFIPIDIYNNTKAERVNEPVKIDLHFFELLDHVLQSD